MRRGPSNLCRAAAVLLAGCGLAASGCVGTHPFLAPGPVPATPIAVPPPGTVPAELVKVTLPEYVIEPPDVLRIEVVQREVVKEKKKDPNDPTKEIEIDVYDKEGRLQFTNTLTSLPLQPVFGEYTVRPDGTVYLGVYGSVNVAGYTLAQAAAAVRDHLTQVVAAGAGGIRRETLLVALDVTQYNSKKYYVITDGGGYGEQVFAFPVTGSETVLDALANIYGLPMVASKRNIWVARRTPHVGQPEQILPVDWIGITQHGVTATNYQVMPGDRIYVKAQRLVTIDTTLARVLQPIERLFGITLLGSSTINQIAGRGQGFNGQ